jgi:hypothetical protein
MRYNGGLGNPAQAPQSAELAPLDFPGLMAETFRTYGRNFRLWVGIAACYEAATLPLQFFEPSMGKGLLSAIQNPNAAYLMGQMELLGRVFGLDLISFCMFQIALAALAYALGARLTVQPVSIARAYRRALERVADIIAAVGLSLVLPFGAWGGAALASIGVGLGAATFLIVVLHSASLFTAALLFAVVLIVLASLPAVIYITLRITLATPVLATEGCGARVSLERSYSLSKGRVLRILGIVALTGFLEMTATSLVDIPFQIVGLVLDLQQAAAPLWLKLLSAAVDRAAAALTIPFLMLALSFAYFDLRARKEGLTVQQLKREISS